MVFSRTSIGGVQVGGNPVPAWDSAFPGGPIISSPGAEGSTVYFNGRAYASLGQGVVKSAPVTAENVGSWRTETLIRAIDGTQFGTANFVLIAALNGFMYATSNSYSPGSASLLVSASPQTLWWAPINPDGTFGAWQQTSFVLYTIPSVQTSPVTTWNFYWNGGAWLGFITQTGSGADIKTMVLDPILGTPSAPVDQGTPTGLPAGFSNSGFVYDGTSLYAVNGVNSSSTTTTAVSYINITAATGVPSSGAWTAGQVTPTGLNGPNVAVVTGLNGPVIYVLGSGGASSATTYYNTTANIKTSVAWTAGTVLPTAGAASAWFLPWPYASAGNVGILFILLSNGVVNEMNLNTNANLTGAWMANGSPLSNGILGSGGTMVTNQDGTQTITIYYGGILIGSNPEATLGFGDVLNVAVQFVSSAGDPSPIAVTSFKIAGLASITALGTGIPSFPFQYTPGSGGSQQNTWRVQLLKTYNDIIQADGPVSYWRLDDAYEATSVVDIVGSHNGTPSPAGSTAVTQQQPDALVGDPNPATLLDGVAGFLTVPNNAAFDFSGTHAYSLEGWVNVKSLPPTGTWWRMFDRQTYVTRNGYGLGLNTQDGHFFTERWAAGAATTVTAATGPKLNTWYHVVATYDGSNLRLYVNGVLVGGPTATAASVTSQSVVLNMGSDTGGGVDGGGFLNGLLDEMAVYNFALSAAQILAHYNAGVNGPTPYADSGIHLDTTNLFAPVVAPRIPSGARFSSIITVATADIPMLTTDTTQTVLETVYNPSLTLPVQPVSPSVTVDTTLMAANVLFTVPGPTTGPTVTDGGAGGTSFHAGQALVAYSYVTAGGESGLSPTTAVNLASNGNKFNVATISGIPAYVTSLRFYLVTVQASDTSGFSVAQTPSSGTVSAFSITAQGNGTAGPATPLARVYHRRNGTTQWTLLVDNVVVTQGVQQTVGPLMDQIPWNSSLDFAVATINSLAESALVTAGTAVVIPVTPVLGGAGMLHIAGNGSSQFVRLPITGGLKALTKMSVFPSEVFGESAPAVRFGVGKFRTIEVRVAVLDVATMKSLQAVRDQVMLGSVAYWRDSAGHVLTVAFDNEISLEHFPSGYLANRPTTLKLSEVPNTYQPSTALGQVPGLFQQVNGTIVPLDLSEVAV